MKSVRDPYSGLAESYDSYLLDEGIRAFYREWQESLHKAIKQQRVNVKVFVDLACGTGNSTIPWTAQPGWSVIGVDCSPAMLLRARAKSKTVRWYRQDLRQLKLPVHADVVTCHFDALNHILAPRDLERVFANVSRLLNEGGLFQFDLNTDAFFRWLNVHEKLFELKPNYIMARNKYDPQSRIVTFDQLWFIKRGGLYQKRKVSVQERAYSVEEIRRMLRKAGMRLLRFEKQRVHDGRAFRLLFLAGKTKAGRRLSDAAPERVR